MYHIITLGYDCSPAEALRNLGRRTQALPFDWIISSFASLERCIKDDFSKFHTNLRFNHNQSRLIDEYGFEFPHDYPLENTSSIEAGEGNIKEETGRRITENWKDYYDTVKEKYNRRIERFRQIMSERLPVIVMCRYSLQDMFKIHTFLTRHYQNPRIFFVNCCPQVFSNKNFITIRAEDNGEWNDVNAWKKGLDTMIARV